MKKGQIVEGIVTELEFPNKGHVETAEGTVLVKGVLPGQELSIMVQKVRHGKAEGRVLSCICPSDKEVDSMCPHAADCGGCSYQTLPYEEQLKLKERQVRDLMQGVFAMQKELGGHGEEIFEGIKGSPKQFGYRNKMEFSFGDAYKDGPLALGMHKKGSFYDIITVDQCQIVDEDYRMILSEVLAYVKEQGWSFYHKLRHTGYLRHLLVRKAEKTQEILIAIITTTQEQHDAELKKLVEKLNGLHLNGRIVGILHTRNDSLADVVQSDETVTLYGQDYFYEELLGLKFKISEFSFFQTNSLGAEVLYETAREYIGQLAEKNGRKQTLYDLYSGTGTIAQMMAPVAEKVIGVEIVEEAVEAARVNADLNGLNNCEFIAGDVLKVLDQIEERPDFIILDPPRDGIHPKALQKIIDYGVDRLVYISCKPTSLARDLQVFLAQEYRVERMCCVDMFPGTVHVETVCLLSKLHEAKHHVNVRLDMDELDLTSAESKATYEEIKAYVAEHNDGMKVSNLYIAQVKAKYGIIERENYNKPKSDDARQPKCPKEKEEAIVEALKAFKMI